jgi:hypothetical protein
MFSWLFGNRSSNVGTRTTAPSYTHSLLKQATAQKRGGDVVAAIRTLRLAYEQIKKGLLTYSVDTFLRLPLYLQEAGRNDEAWSEFNKLIIEGYPNQLNDLGVRAMEHSKVYDKMRLFLQREGKNVEAIVFGVLSMLATVKGLHSQKRKGELTKLVSRKNIEATLEPLVKEGKKMAHSEQIVEFILHEAKDPAHLDMTRAAKRTRELMARTGPA